MQIVLEVYSNLGKCDEFVGLSQSESYFVTLNQRWCFLPLFWPLKVLLKGWGSRPAAQRMGVQRQGMMLITWGSGLRVLTGHRVCDFHSQSLLACVGIC